MGSSQQAEELTREQQLADIEVRGGPLIMSASCRCRLCKALMPVKRPCWGEFGGPVAFDAFLCLWTMLCSHALNSSTPGLTLRKQP